MFSVLEPGEGCGFLLRHPTPKRFICWSGPSRAGSRAGGGGGPCAGAPFGASIDLQDVCSARGTLSRLRWRSGGRWGRKDGPAVWQLPAECRRGSEWRRRSGRVVEWATEVRGPAVRKSPRGNWGLLGRSRLPEQQVLDYDEERIEKLLAFEQVIQLRATDPGKRPPRLAEAGQALALPEPPVGSRLPLESSSRPPDRRSQEFSGSAAISCER